MFKKSYSSFLAVIFSLVFMFGVTACSSDDASSEPANTEPVAAAPETAAEPEVIVEVEECDEEALLNEKAVSYFNNLPETSNMMKADKFKEQFELSRESVVVLDIRKSEDFAKAHLEGALNIPMAEIGQRITEIPMDQEIAVICYSGQSASQTAGVLKMAGYNTKIITGGFGAIEKAEFEMVN